ncbi:MAG: hypothetical protein JSW00_06555 [Thermoplasmata archaeon]|nr:MAG: hypothetical protein JSW00_06555 [Thermoplasmata archaeon]
MCSENELAKRTRHLVEFLITDQSSYHHHKETMAHACVVLEVGLFAWIMTKDGWMMIRYAGFFTWFIIITIWCLLHLYLRWELRNRRWSAIQIDALYEILRRWAVTDPTPEELQSYQKPDKKPDDCLNRLWKKIDFLIPYSPGGISVEDESSGYPRALVQAFTEAAHNAEHNTRLKFGEWLPSVFSLLIIVFVVGRGCMDC